MSCFLWFCLMNVDPNRVCCQQSLVLISKLPYVTFFHSLLKIMAPEYFEKQEPCLEAGALCSALHLLSPVVVTCRYVYIAQ